MMKNLSALLLLVTGFLTAVESFIPAPCCFGVSIPSHRFVATSNDNNNNNNNDVEDDLIDDTTLLETVPLTQFQSLCETLALSVEGTKEELLARLRQHALDEAALDQQRKLERAKKVEQGVGDVSKERYEIVSDEIDGSSTVDDEGFFYFSAPGNETAATKVQAKAMTDIATTAVDNSNNNNSNNSNKKTARQVITAPPPPEHVNEKGERVVTVYSTTETNDLTGAAAAQKGADKSVLLEGGDDVPGPWELGSDKNNVPVALQTAKDTVTELVRSLLILSGAPGFREDFTEGLQPMESTHLDTSQMMPTSTDFIGFDPSQVPGDVLVASSKSLRAGRGSVLQDVLNELELRAVGHDGMAGDNRDKGGGHYQQVSKVRAFLEGFRRAEVRRVARETTTLLLDKVASEGIQGLDAMLSTMTKVQDDSGEAGELSDSLLDFLNDMVREQETRVGDARQEQQLAEPPSLEDSKDKLEELWDVSNDGGDGGGRVETLDPKDPQVKAALEEEQAKLDGATTETAALPSRAPEQMLLLLKLLRDRIKAEAAFGGGNGGSEEDQERGRNLRVLAYCLQFDRPMDREKLIRREYQSNVDRMDGFLELVASSMEYAESTSTQLQPSSGLLNRKLLGAIYDLSRKIRDETAATGR